MVHNQGDDSILRLKIVAFVATIWILFAFLTIPPQTHAKFVIASHSWSYPDENGQGIENVYFSVSKPHDNPVNWSYQYYNNTESAGLEVPNNATVAMRVKVWMNSTLTGYTFVQGRDQFTRVGIVISVAGHTVFSQNNISQDGGSSDDDPMFIYYYRIYLHGDPDWLGPTFLAGTIYTVVFNYEIYFL